MAVIKLEIGENLLEAIKIISQDVDKFNKSRLYADSVASLGGEIKTAFGINFTKMAKMQSKLAKKGITEISITA